MNHDTVTKAIEKHAAIELKTHIRIASSGGVKVTQRRNSAAMKKAHLSLSAPSPLMSPRSDGKDDIMEQDNIRLRKELVS